MHKETKRIIFQVALFIVTFVTTTLAGSDWVYGRSIYAEDYSWKDFASGLEFSIPLLLILTVHEFGHYFIALYHKIKVSLPYYIPMPPIPFSIGTLGAVIRLRERPESNLKHFDIGLAGPLAGFIVALVILFYGFKTLPPPEYIFKFHPDYKEYGLKYADHVYGPEYVKKYKEEYLKTYKEEYFKEHKGEIDTAALDKVSIEIVDIRVGKNLIFWIFEKFAADPARVPNVHEIHHYPILFAVYIGLFVTCLNLLPIGQLDGGHVVYGLFGFKTHKIIATVFFVALVLYAGLGLPYISPEFNESIFGLPAQLVTIPGYIFFLYSCFTGLFSQRRNAIMYALLVFAIHYTLLVYAPGIVGYEGWLLFAFILGRFLGIQHPTSEIEKPLDSNRIILGWITLLIFILCFSPAPLEIKSL